jgi:hypothetical protein
MKSKLAYFITGLIGVCLGGAGALLQGARGAPQPASTASASSSPTPSSQGHVFASGPLRHAQPAPAFAGEDAEQLDQEPSSASDELPEVEAHRRGLAAHEAEPRDPAWAGEAEATITSSLDSLLSTSNRTWKVDSVDCRTSTCRIDVAWPNYSSASSDFGELLSATYGLPCASEVTLPPPQEPTQEYRGSFLLSCGTGQNARP